MLNIESSSASSKRSALTSIFIAVVSALLLSSCSTIVGNPMIVTGTTAMEDFAAPSFVNEALEHFFSRRDDELAKLISRNTSAKVNFYPGEAALRIEFAAGDCVDVDAHTYEILGRYGYMLDDVSSGSEPWQLVSQYHKDGAVKGFIDFTISDQNGTRCLVEIYANLEAIN